MSSGTRLNPGARTPRRIPRNTRSRHLASSGTRRLAMANPIRLLHSDAQQYFLVHDGCVYADLDGDGRIGKHERYTGAAESALLAAARHFADYYVAPFPGARSHDPQITNAGRQNNKEASTFEPDPKGV